MEAQFVWMCRASMVTRELVCGPVFHTWNVNHEKSIVDLFEVHETGVSYSIQ